MFTVSWGRKWGWLPWNMSIAENLLYEKYLMAGKVRDLTKGRRGPKMLGAFAFPPPRNQAPSFLTIYGAPDGSKSQACWETVIHIKLTGHKC